MPFIIRKLQELFNAAGLPSAFSCTGCENSLRNLLMTRFRDQYIQKWNSQLSRTSSRKGSAGNKLRTYRLFKTTFELEPYLYLTKIIKHRVALTRLRISCHSLEIERGRYHKPASTPAHLRLCKDCESVEDELHFVCVCPKYDLLREHLVSIVCNDNPNFVFLSVNDKFLNLMQALDSHVLTALSKFVFMSFKLICKALLLLLLLLYNTGGGSKR